jgi:hypothetical protein
LTLDGRRVRETPPVVLDAALLLAHVMAVRGGDIESDLRLLRRRKMPVYSLQAALAEPDSYKGRAVILRAAARDGRNTGGGRTFRLVETKLMAESRWVTAPRTTRIDVRDDSEVGSLTQHDLADEFGVSAERIRQIEVKAMQKMKAALAEAV